MEFGIGAHDSHCKGGKYSEDRTLKLLHYKFLGEEYVKNLYEGRRLRLSDRQRKMGICIHWDNVPFDYMKKMLSDNYQVI